jgi:ABC-type uncharacterized transport system substrate-binding protein
LPKAIRVGEGILPDLLPDCGKQAGPKDKISALNFAIYQADHLRAAATELIALRPDVILAVTSVAARLVAEQTQSIPIVFLLSIDPVAEGLIAIVPRPGGNITSFTQSDYDLGGKWLQLLKEVAPGITAAAIITSPLSPLAPMSDGSRAVGYMPSVEDAARSMGISVSVVEIRNPIEIEEKISGLKLHQGVIFPPNSFIAVHRARIIELLTRFRVPGVYFARSRTELAGGRLHVRALISA